MGKERELGLDRGPAAGLAPKSESPTPSPPTSSPTSPPSPALEQQTPPSSAPQRPSPPEEPTSATSAFERSRTQQPSQTSVEKDIQVLTAKMDSLKAILDNINQRLANIERLAHESQQEEYRY